MITERVSSGSSSSNSTADLTNANQSINQSNNQSMENENMYKDLNKKKHITLCALAVSRRTRH
jgi:hypothetical protein